MAMPCTLLSNGLITDYFKFPNTQHFHNHIDKTNDDSLLAINPSISSLSYNLDMILAIQAKEHELCRNIINDYLLSASQNCSVGSAQDNFSQVLTSSKQDTFSSCTFSAENINPCLQVKTKNIDLLPDFINSSDLKLCSSQISSPASSSSPTTSLYYDQNEKDKRPHGCKECGKRFRFKSNLFEHKSLHQKTFPFMCPFCGKTCRLKGNLKKHLQIHVATVEDLEKLWKDRFSRSSGRPRKNAALMPLPVFGEL